MGMSTFFVHSSPTIFSDPKEFVPERWIGENENGKEREKWLVAFSKGPRSCLGINLAWCELYFLFAALVRRVELRIDGTVKEDLGWRDCFTPFFPGRHFMVRCERVGE